MTSKTTAEIGPLVEDRRENVDRRGAPRRKVLRGARTFWPNGDSSECTVCNLSETGAQLELNGPAPNSFEFVIEGEEWRRKCTVVWRKGNRVGVKFQQPLQFTSAPRRSKGVADFGRYAVACQLLAGRVAPTDRALLLEMAEAWEAAVRRLRRQARRT